MRTIGNVVFAAATIMVLGINPVHADLVDDFARYKEQISQIAKDGISKCKNSLTLLVVKCNLENLEAKVRKKIKRCQEQILSVEEQITGMQEQMDAYKAGKMFLSDWELVYLLDDIEESRSTLDKLQTRLATYEDLMNKIQDLQASLSI